MSDNRRKQKVTRAARSTKHKMGRSIKRNQPRQKQINH